VILSEYLKLCFNRRWQTGNWLLFLASPIKSNQKEGDPSLPRLRRTLDNLPIAGLRNSHDPLRVHVLKQSSPNSTAICRLSTAAHRG
jgi:hypothetical protein